MRPVSRQRQAVCRLSALLFSFTQISRVSEGIQVHSGFQETFERTADGLLAGVMKGLADFGVKKVVVTGHSLGAPPLFILHLPQSDSFGRRRRRDHDWSAHQDQRGSVGQRHCFRVRPSAGWQPGVG